MLACGILLIVFQPGVEPTYPASEAWSFNRWTAREVPWRYFKYLANINHLTSEQAAANYESQADLTTSSETYLG